jgi:hypothetical protein
MSFRFSLAVGVMLAFPLASASDLTSAQGIGPGQLPITGATPGAEVLARFLRKSGAPSGRSQHEEATPLFEVMGPALTPAFWADRDDAAMTLRLQGELLIAMGQVLVRHGQALQLEEKGVEVGAVSSNIGSRLALLLRNRTDSDRKVVNVVVLVHGPWGGKIEQRLRRAGFEPSGAVGSAISGSVAIDRVEELAKLPDVMHIELSSPFRVTPPAVQAQPEKP